MDNEYSGRLVMIGRTLLLSLLLVCTGVNATQNILAARYASWAEYGPSVSVDNFDGKSLSHLIYEGVQLQQDGSLKPLNVAIDFRKNINFNQRTLQGNYQLLAELKQRNPNLSLLLNLGGWQHSENFRSVLSHPESTQRFAEHLHKWLTQYQFDGVVIDWRYPTSLEQEDDLQRLMGWLSQFRQLTQAKPVTVWMVLPVTNVMQANQNRWPIAELSQLVDYFELLNVHFSGFWSVTADHQAPLFAEPPLPSSEQSVKFWLSQGVNPKQLIFSVNAQASSWRDVKQLAPSGQHSGAAIGSYDDEAFQHGGVNVADVKSLAQQPDYQLMWDDKAQASYLYSQQRYGGHWLSVENEQSLQSKVNYVVRHQLAGFSVHNAFYDDFIGQGLLDILAHRWLDPHRTARHIGLGICAVLLVAAGAWWCYFKIVVRYWYQKQYGQRLVQAIRLLQHASNRTNNELALLQQHQAERVPDQFTERFQAQCQDWKQLSDQLLPELRQSQCSTNVEADLLAWLQSSLYWLNQESLVFDFKHQLSSPHLAAFDPLYLSDVLRYLRLNANGQVIRLQLNKALTQLQLDIQFSQEIAIPLLATNKALQTLETGYRLSFTSKNHLLAEQRVQALTSFSQALKDNQSTDAADMLVEQLKADPKVEAVWLEDADSSPSRSAQVSDDEELALHSHALQGMMIRLSGKAVFSNEDKQYYASLLTQLDLIKQSVGQLLENKRLFNDLHLIVSNKANLLFIRGEKGYSGIVVEGKSEPIIITTRLRHLLWYLRDDMLFQVHRSYLVNPSRVDALQKTNSQYQLTVSGHTLPVAKRYVDKLKRKLSLSCE